MSKITEDSIVCACMNIEYGDILKYIKETGNTDLDTVSENTEAGTACECCKSDECDKVELPLPMAIERAIKELK